MDKVRVLIAEGATFTRIMLAMALEKTNFEVAGEAKDGVEAVDKCKELKPDVMLVDVALNEKDGIAVTREVVKENPSVIVIMLITEGVDPSRLVVEAVRAGAAGYIKKPLTVKGVETSIRDVLKK